ncbi:M23 family metallopeptidase [uncultured Amphritea sp.]|uniref:M23 family metallopeptidase n=1 Tax=uncultured Amphritea sp. TaxID=981605 RepID=UPI00261D4659|nr:M23 family metallopeptidase [uncultured Amphritea sp.]
MRMKKRYRFLVISGLILGLGFIIPEPKIIPVSGATGADWNKDTFWYEPWGRSGVHKGIDIFAQKGTAVVASSNMLILYRGSLSKGGNVIVGLGPKWRIHYFAHLHDIDHTAGPLLQAGQSIGSVGDSGNARGKPAHLHFSILTLLPRPWAIDTSTQGYKKAFYLNPISYFAD